MEHYSIEKVSINSLIKTTLQDLGINLEVPMTHYLTPFFSEIVEKHYFAYCTKDDNWLLIDSSPYLLYKHKQSGKILKSLFLPIKTIGHEPITKFAIHQSEKFLLTLHLFKRRTEELDSISTLYHILKITGLPDGKEIWRSEKIPDWGSEFITQVFDQYVVYYSNTELVFFNFNLRKIIKRIALDGYVQSICITSDFDIYLLTHAIYKDKTVYKFFTLRNGLENSALFLNFSFESVENSNLVFSTIAAGGKHLLIYKKGLQILEIYETSGGMIIKSIHLDLLNIAASSSPEIIFLQLNEEIHLLDLINFEIHEIQENSEFQDELIVLRAKTGKLKNIFPNEEIKYSEYQILKNDSRFALCGITKEIRDKNEISYLDLSSLELKWNRNEQNCYYRFSEPQNSFYKCIIPGNQSVELYDYDNSVIVNRHEVADNNLTQISSDLFLHIHNDCYKSSHDTLTFNFWWPTGKNQILLQCNKNPRLFYSYDSKRIFIIEENSKMSVFDISDGKNLKLLNIITDQFGYECQNFEKNNKTVIFRLNPNISNYSGTNLFLVINNSDGKLLWRFEWKGNKVSCCDYDDNLQLFVFHQFDNSIVHVDIKDNHVIHSYQPYYLYISKIYIISHDKILFSADEKIIEYNHRTNQETIICNDCSKIAGIFRSKVYYSNQSGAYTIYDFEKRKEIASIYLHGTEFLVCTKPDSVSETGWFYTNNTDLITVVQKDKSGKIIKIITKGDQEREVYIYAHNRKDIILALLNDDTDSYNQLVQPIINNQFKLEFERKDKKLSIKEPDINLNVE